MNIQELGDRIAALSAREAGDVRAYLKDNLGIEAPAGGPSVNPVPEPTPPISTEFNVVLNGVDDAKRIQVIRTLRELTKQALAEAKAMAESFPKTVQTGVDATTAAATKKLLEDAGAKVTIQPV